MKNIFSANANSLVHKSEKVANRYIIMFDRSREHRTKVKLHTIVFNKFSVQLNSYSQYTPNQNDHFDMNEKIRPN